MSFRRALLDTLTKSIGVERLIQSLHRVFFEKEYQINGIRFKVSMTNRMEKWRWDQLVSRSSKPKLKRLYENQEKSQATVHRYFARFSMMPGNRIAVILTSLLPFRRRFFP
jgi:hypothetical protein